jgi:hypothetical protein
MTEEDIRRLHSSFNELVGPPEWAITFSDGLDRTYKNLDDVLSLENPTTHRVRAVKIESRSDKGDIRALLAITDAEYSNATIHLNGPEDPVIRLNQHIQDRLQAMRPWYARATRTDFVSFVFLALLVLYVGGLAIIPFLSSDVGNRPISSERQAKLSAIFILAIIGAFVGGWALNKLRARLFPSTMFALGQGRARHEHLERIRWGVAIAFVVGVAGSLVVALV